MLKLPKAGIAFGFIMALSATTQAATSDYVVTEFPNGVVCYKLKHETDRSACVYVPPPPAVIAVPVEPAPRKGFKEAIQDGQQYASQANELLNMLKADK
ncbi:hypothetical protein [Pseudomonas helleri]|uniref:hypothetical protein n=1 Tax=Pseudomonas helleri TaxID=1608996 RepID=UPI00242ADB66|nr:hypothetical protein [Pseudomonas helleri]